MSYSNNGVPEPYERMLHSWTVFILFCQHVLFLHYNGLYSVQCILLHDILSMLSFSPDITCFNLHNTTIYITLVQSCSSEPYAMILHGRYVNNVQNNSHFLVRIVQLSSD